MQTEAEQLIKETWQELPEKQRQAISSIPWQTLVKEIGLAKELPNEKLETLERETLLILYGLEEASVYPSNLASELGIPENQALEIAEEVKVKILTPIYRNFIDEKLLEAPKEIVAEPTEPVVELKIPEMPKTSFAPKTELPPEKSLPEVKPPEPPKAVTDRPKMASYPGGVDPYREPTS